MTKIEFYFLSFIILTFLACPTKAQDTTDSLTRSLMQHAITVRDFGRTIPQEKVYLHFDNTSYYQGDKIWFQSYVVSADQNRLSNLSKTLCRTAQPRGYHNRQTLAQNREWTLQW